MEHQKFHEQKNENNDKGHGRLEQRTAVFAHKIDWLQKNHQWPGLQAIGKSSSCIAEAAKTTQEARHYLSSLPLSAQKLNEVARANWGIENQLHWRLDVVFNEDGACIRNDNAAENIGILRKWALNVLQKARKIQRHNRLKVLCAKTPCQ